ncbi:hypothetical protein IT084_16990 [Desulfallas sp. Bu1-1]|uniref:hypothetical protein n=1 Tax=Desulfallas sp. Bu1-1 TaxID=2787620 RepID=UPI00189E6646|nr:hypothetical protein [Desulfallas sp. Bu1-1]MBF7084637.1 hypothetical protein [Desulfallas sp. Bu1-1]
MYNFLVEVNSNLTSFGIGVLLFVLSYIVETENIVINKLSKTLGIVLMVLSFILLTETILSKVLTLVFGYF